MLEDLSPEHQAIFQALRCQPRQIDGSVDAYGGVGIAAVEASGQSVFFDVLELRERCKSTSDRWIFAWIIYIRHSIFIPRIGTVRLRELGFIFVVEILRAGVLGRLYNYSVTIFP